MIRIMTTRLIDKVVEDARNYYPRVRAAAEGMEIRIVRVARESLASSLLLS